MATITDRQGYRVLNYTDAEGNRKHTSLAKIGVLSAKQERDILIAKEFELSTGARLLNVHRRPAPRFEQFAREYLIWHRGEYPDSHYRVAQILHDHLIPEFGLDPMNLIAVQKAEDYKTKRRFQVRASSITKELRVLHAVINRAVALKKIAENPIAIVQAPQHLDSKPHHWYEDPTDLAKLYAVSAYGPAWKFLANTGLRRGESLYMRRIWITDAVRVRSTGEERTKAGEWRKIPLTAGGREALAALADVGPYLLPRMAPESLSRAFARDARAAGIGGSLHSLRHTYICRLLLANVPIRTVQLYAGHASITTTEKYAYQVLRNDPAAAVGLDI